MGQSQNKEDRSWQSSSTGELVRSMFSLKKYLQSYQIVMKQSQKTGIILAHFNTRGILRQGFWILMSHCQYKNKLRILAIILAKSMSYYNRMALADGTPNLEIYTRATGLMESKMGLPG